MRMILLCALRPIIYNNNIIIIPRYITIALPLIGLGFLSGIPPRNYIGEYKISSSAADGRRTAESHRPLGILSAESIVSMILLLLLLLIHCRIV